ncbi:MAG: endonuclease domain-containing protein [Arthrobacter sp.]|jgi:hypothetical protein|nr:endonuclease domain-containing protein [Arthrobacter sp.]
MEHLNPLAWPDALVSSALTPGVRQRFDAGDYVRLISGWYVRSETWLAARRHERFAWVVAARTARSSTMTLCGEAALMAMGLPVAGAPERIHVAEASRSRSGSLPDTFAARGPRAAELEAAWRPQLHRHQHPYAGTYDTGVFRCVEPLEAAMEVMTRLSLIRALPVADGLARWGSELGIGDLEVRLAIDGVAARVRRERARLAWDARSSESGSVGESMSRALILANGFETPVLQVALFDSRGRVGIVDFCWPGAKIIGEFDGRLKYDGSLGDSRSADQVFGQEKARENRLTALGYRVVRWGWADLLHPERLMRLLRAAGVPRH